MNETFSSSRLKNKFAIKQGINEICRRIPAAVDSSFMAKIFPAPVDKIWKGFKDKMEFRRHPIIITFLIEFDGPFFWLLDVLNTSEDQEEYEEESG